MAMFYYYLIFLLTVSKGEKLAVMEGDILPDIIHPHLGGRHSFVNKDRLWTNGLIRYFVSPGVNKTLITEAMQGLSDSTCLRFEEVLSDDGDGDIVDFQPTNEEACVSCVGKQGGLQKVYLHRVECKSKEVKHELGHVLGLVHEHNRVDRNEYLKIHWENIERKYYDDFKIRKPYGPNEIEGVLDSNTPFDFMSLMLYKGNAFAIRNRNYLTMTAKLHSFANFGTGTWDFSPLDLLELNIAYECLLPPEMVESYFYEVVETFDELTKSFEIEVAKKKCPPRDVKCPCDKMGRWYHEQELFSYCSRTIRRNMPWCPVGLNTTLTADTSYGVINCSHDQVLACDLLPSVEHLLNGCPKPIDQGTGTWDCNENICQFKCRQGFTDPTHDRTECSKGVWSMDPAGFSCSRYTTPSFSSAKCPCMRRTTTSLGLTWAGDWMYNNIPQKYCSDPSGRGQKWCPTQVDSDGNYKKNSNSYVWCNKQEDLACSKLPGRIYENEGKNCPLQLSNKNVSEILEEFIKKKCIVNSDLFVAYAAEIKYKRKKMEHELLEKKKRSCLCPKYNTKVRRNGILTCSSDDLTCALNCNAGYSASNVSTSQCLDDGNWTVDPSQFICVSDDWKFARQPHVAVVSVLKILEIYHPSGLRSCNLILPPKFPKRRRSHSSHFINNILLVCGGSYTRRSCQQLKKGQHTWKHHSRLIERRYGHSSVVMDDVLYLIGGRKSPTTTEFFSKDASKWTKGFDLTGPGVINGCTARLTNDTFLITGGKLSHDKVMECSVSKEGCIILSRGLSIGRYLHGCAMVEIQGSQHVLVVGGLDKNGKRLQSTEILDLQTNIWRNGSDLKEPVSSPKIVVVGQGDVFVMGGWAKDGFVKTVQKLDPQNSQIWQWVNQRDMINASTGFAVSAVPVSWFGECSQAIQG